MFLKKIDIHNYKIFKDIEINLEKSDISDVFSIASVNGGGKSTLLQFIFIMLHCPLYPEYDEYIENLLKDMTFPKNDKTKLVNFEISDNNKTYYLEFFIDRDSEDSDTFEVLSLDRNINLFCKTTMDDDLLDKLSKKIYLISPNSQVFHFLDQKNKELIGQKVFKKSKISQRRERVTKDTFTSYSDAVESLKENLKNFETYDLFSTKVILNVFEEMFKEDREKKIKDGIYGDSFDNLTTVLEDFLEDKKITINAELTEIMFKLKSIDKIFSYTDLSHGELKKLGLFIWLKYFVQKDSIVLMDEVDIALHPSWQYDLVDNIEEWSSNNTQFFLATHSPQILSSTYYKNLILLDKQDNYSTVHQLDKPLDNNDVNSVIDLIMGTNHLPKKLDELHVKYRNLVKDGKEESQEAIDIKQEILEWESINSSFFRRIDFFKKMKK